MKSLFRLFMASALLAVSALAQTSTPSPTQNAATATDQFTVSENVVGLSSKAGYVPASLTTGGFAVTKNWALQSDNLVASAADYFGFGLRYQLSSAKIFAKTNFDPNTFGFFVAVTGGEVLTANGKHPGFMAHGIVRYDPTRSGKFSVDLLDAGVTRLPYVQTGVAGFYSAGLKFGF